MREGKAEWITVNNWRRKERIIGILSFHFLMKKNNGKKKLNSAVLHSLIQHLEPGIWWALRWPSLTTTPIYPLTSTTTHSSPNLFARVLPSTPPWALPFAHSCVAIVKAAKVREKDQQEIVHTSPQGIQWYPPLKNKTNSAYSKIRTSAPYNHRLAIPATLTTALLPTLPWLLTPSLA